MERDTWKTTTGFILAAVGSAVGLGNIWRFSYLCHRNGGGSFLVPYLIAILAVGIPVLILEFAIGHKMHASAPKALWAIHRKWEWLGWWPVLFVTFGIDAYYVVVIGWCVLYAFYSGRAMFTGSFPWAGDTEGYFLHRFLHLSDGVTQLGGIQWPILVATGVVWFLIWYICVHRVDSGVELACRIFMPLLALLTTALIVWGLFLDGAALGLTEYMRPDMSKLGEIQVWRDAFGQVFFSVSIGFGIMIAYASYLPPKTDLVKAAFITTLVDCGYSIFAGIAVYSVLGYMAITKGVGFEEVVADGPGLCFIVYPEAITLLPGMNGLFGLLFFSTLTIAGITSAMSIIEAFASASIDKFGWKRRKVVTISCLLGFLGSVLFTTGAGLHWLDIVDHFINSYGLITVGLLECILVIWYYHIDHLHFHLADAAEGGYPNAWDNWWEFSVKYVAPLSLIFILAWSVVEDLTHPYGGYPPLALILIGGVWLLGPLLVAFLFSACSRHKFLPEE